jgi:integrase
MAFRSNFRSNQKRSRLQEERFSTAHGGPRTNVRIDELIADVMSEYKEKQQDVNSIEPRWRLHLRPFFTRRKASDVSTETIRRYIKQRIDQNTKPGTINRELALLKRSFYAAQESTPPKVQLVPFFSTLQEKNARSGFLADRDYAKLARECAAKGLWLRTALAIGATFGWRLDEVIGLRIRQVDLANREIRLEPNTTKIATVGPLT